MGEPNLRDVSLSNEEKCFVEEIHTDMHSENSHGKKIQTISQSRKSSSKRRNRSRKEETIASVKEETTTSGKEGEGIDFFYILAGGGVLIGIILVIFLIFRYVLHMI